MARALACGVPVVACPYAGDQAENAARIRWSGLGVSLPRRFQNARGVRLAVRRLLAEPTFMRRAEALKAWAEEHPGGANAAQAVEALAAWLYGVHCLRSTPSSSSGRYQPTTRSR